MFQSLEDDPYGPGKLRSMATQQPIDDTQRLRKAQTARESHVRNKSSIPKRVTESQPVDRENPFNTNNNATNLTMLGFNNDFLGFAPNPNLAKAVSKEDMSAAENNPYDNLDDIDFRTNPGGQPLLTPLANQYYPSFDVPSFGNFDKKTAKSPTSSQKQGEYNLLDL